MKKITTICAVLLMAVNVFAQTPEKMSYQAVIRDGSNNLVTGTAVGMQISILQGSPSGIAVYEETQMPTSNANGLVSLEIGSGTLVSGDFTTIDWSNGPYFIKTETDPTGGTNYTIIGTSQLLSVPYALHAKMAEGILGGIVETDPVFGLSIASGITGNDTANWNSKQDQLIAGNNITIVGDTINANGIVETDPVFGLSVASGITGNDTANWNSKQGQLIAGNNITIVGDTINATGGGSSNWTPNGNNIYNSNSGSVGVGLTNPLHTFAVGKTDSTTALAVGFVGSFNNAHSGRLIFSEDLSFNGDCGLMFQHNGTTNNLHLIGGCTTFGDTVVRFNRNGYSNIRQLRVGTNILTNALNPLSVDGNSDFTGNVTITGNLNVTGNIAKGGGTFKIDHPLDPANKYLVHSFVESPEMMNIYSGNIATDANGFATVELPSYFEAANKDFRYQLTVIGAFAQAIIKEKISDNKFIIQTNQPNIEVSWSVTGIRADKYANANRVQDEVEKELKGTYIHPELFGASRYSSESKVKENQASNQTQKKADADQ